MRSLSISARIGRAALGALAFAALVMLVAVPPGYMVGGGAKAATVHIVICTSHGPVNAAIDLGKTLPAKGGKSGAGCAFAAHAGASPLPVSPIVGAHGWRDPARLLPVVSQVSVGRGLAAPPPARGPPFHL